MCVCAPTCPVCHTCKRCSLPIQTTRRHTLCGRAHGLNTATTATQNSGQAARPSAARLENHPGNHSVKRYARYPNTPHEESSPAVCGALLDTSNVSIAKYKAPSLNTSATHAHNDHTDAPGQTMRRRIGRNALTQRCMPRDRIKKACPANSPSRQWAQHRPLIASTSKSGNCTGMTSHGCNTH